MVDLLLKLRVLPLVLFALARDADTGRRTIGLCRRPAPPARGKEIVPLQAPRRSGRGRRSGPSRRKQRNKLGVFLKRHRQIMCAPRIADRLPRAAPRRAADLFFKLKQNKIAKILAAEFPAADNPATPPPTIATLYVLPIVRRNFEISLLTQDMSKPNALPDYLALGKPARRIIAACRQGEWGTEECCQYFSAGEFHPNCVEQSYCSNVRHSVS